MSIRNVLLLIIKKALPSLPQLAEQVVRRHDRLNGACVFALLYAVRGYQRNMDGAARLGERLEVAHLVAQGFLDALGDGEIVLVRVRRDPETRAYMEKRCSRGAGAKRKSKKEAMRCLQRYVVREVYHALRHPFESPSGSEGAELRAARKKARLTQADAAAAIGCSISAISKYETGKRRFREIGKR